MPDPILLTLEVSFQAPVLPDGIEAAAIQLSDELRQLKVESVELARTASMREGTKAGDALTLGGIAIAVVPELISEVVKLVFGWINRDPKRTVTVRRKRGGPEYEITGSWTPNELARIMKALAEESPRPHGRR